MRLNELEKLHEMRTQYLSISSNSRTSNSNQKKIRTLNGGSFDVIWIGSQIKKMKSNLESRIFLSLENENKFSEDEIESFIRDDLHDLKNTEKVSKEILNKPQYHSFNPDNF